ncbi:MAG: ATP-dependent 6-phosphofructokinase [Planctomycetota bacterium]
MKKIAILTGGGDAPGLNGVIRGAVLTCEQLGIEVVGVRNGFEGFSYEEGIIPLTRRSVRGILWRGGSILGCNNRYRGEIEMYLERMKKEGIEGVVISGGDGTLAMANRLHEAGARVIGVPKTIDNDVTGTSVTFGFHSAVEIVADACSRLVDTAESHHRAMILEVMGRHAGHIALHGGMAGSADIVLIPEIPFELYEVAKVIRDRAEGGRNYSMVVVAEGAKPRGGDVVVDSHRTEQAGREILGGVGEWLAAQLRGLVDHDVRDITLGHLQRGGTPAAFDRTLGTRMGVCAAQALVNGESGLFTAYWNACVELRPLADAAGGMRGVDPEGEMVNAARRVGIAFGDRQPHPKPPKNR